MTLPPPNDFIDVNDPPTDVDISPPWFMDDDDIDVIINHIVSQPWFHSPAG